MHSLQKNCYDSSSCMFPAFGDRYLAEIGALEILNVDNTPLALMDMYAKLAEDVNRYGCSWESFEVYRHLKFLGYIVGRHNVPWSMKTVNVKTNAQEGTTEYGGVIDRRSLDSGCITDMFADLHLGETRPIFNVYPPNSKFKKSSPGNPSFVLCLSRYAASATYFS